MNYELWIITSILLSKKFSHSKVKKSWNNLFLITWFFRKITWLKFFTFMILNENKTALHTKSIFNTTTTLQQNAIKSKNKNKKSPLNANYKITRLALLCSFRQSTLFTKRARVLTLPTFLKPDTSNLKPNYLITGTLYHICSLFFVLWHSFLDEVST